MKKMYLFTIMQVLCLLMIAQPFQQSYKIVQGGIPKKTGAIAKPNIQHNNAGRAATNAYISYLDDNANNASVTGDSFDLFYGRLNLRYGNRINLSYKYGGVFFDSLIDVQSSYPSLSLGSYAGKTVTVDSIQIIYLHERNITNKPDTLKFSVFNTNQVTVTGTGSAAVLNTPSLWSQTYFATGANDFNAIGTFLNPGIYSKVVPVNVTLPQGQAFGVRVDYQGDTTNKFNMLMGFRDNCLGSCLYSNSTIESNTFNYLNFTTATNVNLSGFSGIGNDCNGNSVVDQLIGCELYYGDFYIIAYVTVNTPGNAPTVVTTAASSITQTTATINGTVNAQSASTAVSFDWGLTTAYGNTATATPATVTGTTTTNVSANLTSLQPGTTYNYRVKGASANGLANGLNRTFTTLAQSGVNCVPNTSATGYSPTASGIACATNSQAYSQDITFRIPSSVTGLNVTTARIDSIVNLPSGLTATTNIIPAVYNGGSYGCFRISGTPNAACGQYRILIYATVNLAQVGPQSGELSSLAAQGSLPGYDPLFIRLVNTGVTCPAVNTSQTANFVSINCNTISLSVTISKTDATCSVKGSATANATGGTSYAYLWSNNGNTQTISNLNAGTYTVTVTNLGNGSTATASTTITLTGSISASTTTTNTTCGFNNGSATANGSGATGGYTYLWNTTSTAQTITALAAATYTVTITASGGCTATATTTVAGSSSTSVSMSKTDAGCNQNNGSATATPSGGSGYSYQWSNNGGNLQTISSLAPGVYTVTVTATGGCTAIGSVTIGVNNNNLSASAAVILQPACGQSNGSVSASVSGGTPNYSYVWNTNPTQSSATASGLGVGYYTVTVTDNNGCSAIASVSLSNVGAPNAGIAGTNAICAGASVQLTATGGGTYQWSNSLGSNATVNVNPSSTTTYTVTVSLNNCAAVASKILTVNQPATSTSNRTICKGQSVLFNGQFLTAGGTFKDTLQTINNCDSIITLNLTVNPPLTGSFSQTICKGLAFVFNGQSLTSTGAYKDTIQTLQGCDSIVTLNLTANPPLTGSFSQTICKGTAFVFNGQSLTATGAYKDTVSTAGGCDSIITLNLTINPALTGSFTQSICAGSSYVFSGKSLTVAGSYKDTVSTTGGCDSIITLNLVVNPLPTPTISQNGNILSTQSYSNYQWQLAGNNIPNANSQNYTATQNGNYTVVVTDNANCINTSPFLNYTSVGIKEIAPTLNVKLLPNPNNGSFKIELSDTKTYDVTITNIIGEIILTAQVQKEHNFTITDAAKGIYLVHIRKNNVAKTMRFSIIR